MMSKENTYRALADKPLIADRWTCRFGWHRWGLWSDAEKRSDSLNWTQHRVCVDCNQARMRRLKEQYV